MTSTEPAHFMSVRTENAKLLRHYLESNVPYSSNPLDLLQHSQREMQIIGEGEYGKVYMGDVLLDSLAVAWGDSSLEKTLAAAPAHPVRAIQVNDLLKRILEAELDSLIEAPRPDRLSAPLSEPLAELPELPELPADS